MGATVTVLGRKKNLSSLLQYIANPKDKKKCVAVTGIECIEPDEDGSLKDTLEEMNMLRSLNKSIDVTQAYHVVHSFDKEESKRLSQKEMHKIAVEFAQKAFPNCQMLVASHADKEHFHTHIAINNIDKETLKRIRIDPKDIKNIQQINDQVLKKHNLEPVDMDYYNNLEKRKNMYSTGAKKLKDGQKNAQEVVQNAVDEVLLDSKVTSFKDFSDKLAKDFNIEVYKFSKNSDKLGYVLYRDEINFFERREELTKLGKTKALRKKREVYVEKTFSARKLGKRYALEAINNQLSINAKAQDMTSSDRNTKKTNNTLILRDCVMSDVALQLNGANYYDTNAWYNSAEKFVLDDNIVDSKFADNDYVGKFYNRHKSEIENKIDDMSELIESDRKHIIKSSDTDSIAYKRETSKLAYKLTVTDLKNDIDNRKFEVPSVDYLVKKLNYFVHDDVKMARAKKDFEYLQKQIEYQKQSNFYDMDF